MGSVYDMLHSRQLVKRPSMGRTAGSLRPSFSRIGSVRCFHTWQRSQPPTLPKKQQLRLTLEPTFPPNGLAGSQSLRASSPVKLIVVAPAAYQCNAATLPCPPRNGALVCNQGMGRKSNSPAAEGQRCFDSRSCIRAVDRPSLVTWVQSDLHQQHPQERGTFT